MSPVIRSGLNDSKKKKKRKCSFRLHKHYSTRTTKFLLTKREQHHFRPYWFNAAVLVLRSQTTNCRRPYWSVSSFFSFNLPSFLFKGGPVKSSEAIKGYHLLFWSAFLPVGGKMVSFEKTRQRGSKQSQQLRHTRARLDPHLVHLFPSSQHFHRYNNNSSSHSREKRGHQ